MNPLLLLDLGGKLLDKFFPDPTARAEAQRKLYEMQQAGQLQEMESAAKIIIAEAQSGSWLTASWRPITMLTFVFIIANNYILYPYLSLFFDTGLQLDIPPDMWDLLKIGIGGYTVGRTVEKSIENYKKK
jgi:hypothetical protein